MRGERAGEAAPRHRASLAARSLAGKAIQSAEVSLARTVEAGNGPFESPRETTRRGYVASAVQRCRFRVASAVAENPTRGPAASGQLVLGDQPDRSARRECWARAGSVSARVVSIPWTISVLTHNNALSRFRLPR
jgi:hypothetical protein